MTTILWRDPQGRFTDPATMLDRLFTPVVAEAERAVRAAARIAHDHAGAGLPADPDADAQTWADFEVEMVALGVVGHTGRPVGPRVGAQLALPAPPHNGEAL